MTTQKHSISIAIVLLLSALLGSTNKPSDHTREVTPLAQTNACSAGQTSVAMCLTAVTGKEFCDDLINEKYGFALLDALKAESKPYHLIWVDAGDLKPSTWELIDRKVNDEKLPVIVALNGPEFSPSGRGHIMTVVKTEGLLVTYADPATGGFRTTTKAAMNSAPSHPDGNFVFVAEPRVEISPLDQRLHEYSRLECKQAAGPLTEDRRPPTTRWISLSSITVREIDGNDQALVHKTRGYNELLRSVSTSVLSSQTSR